MDFQEVYDGYRMKIVRFMGRMVGEQYAEDLAQEVFIKVHRALPGFRGESSLSTWIYKIAANTALDRLKTPAYRQAGREQAPADVPYEDDIPEAADDTSPSVDQNLIKEQMNECIRGLVAKLHPAYRVVITLSEMNELSNREIADVLGVSIDTVKIRLHRARAALKKEFEKSCNFYRDDRNEFSCEPKTTPIKFK